MFPTFHLFRHTENVRRPAIRLLAVTVAMAMLHTLFLVPAALAQNFGGWNRAESVDSERAFGVNSFRNDGCPYEAPDGGTLFFASDRDPNGPPTALPKDLDIWIAHWDDAQGRWGDAEPLPSPVNTGAAEFCPTPVPGNRLLFVSTRSSNPCGANPNIYYTQLVMHPKPTWRTPVPLPCGATSVNSPFQEWSPSLVEAGGRTWLYFSSTRDTGTLAQKIYVTELQADGTWSDAQLVPELSSALSDARPNVRKDGLEIVFDSNRAGSFDIYTSTRGSVDEPWLPPVPLGTNVNDPNADETRATLSRDGTRLYFGSTRANGVLGGSGADIYVSTRPGPGLRLGQNGD